MVLVAGVAVTALGCTDPSSRWEVGGLYSISGGDGFRVAKILAIEPEAVSVRIYRDAFASRPATVAPAALSLGKVDDPAGFGIGHVPLTARDFALLFPVHLLTEPVGDDELDGYRLWKESGGGAISDEDPADPEAPREKEAR